MATSFIISLNWETRRSWLLPLLLLLFVAYCELLEEGDWEGLVVVELLLLFVPLLVLEELLFVADDEEEGEVTEEEEELSWPFFPNLIGR